MNDVELRKLIGLRIAIARKIVEISQDELADAIGANKQTVSRWERGVRSPNAEYLRSIAVTCGCTADFLLGFTDTIEVQ